MTIIESTLANEVAIDATCETQFLNENAYEEILDTPQQSIIENNEEPIPIDRKTQFRNAKKIVRSYLGQKIAFGSNSLLVKKTTGKYINMVEIQNGLVHEHKRHDMIASAKYINYKKSILSRPHSSLDEIDLKNQSAGYYQQMNNIIELEDEIKYLINLMHDNSKCALDFNIEFSRELVKLNIEDGTSIDIYFRYEDNTKRLALSHDINLTNIFCLESLQLVTFLQLLSDLVLGSTSKASLEFKDYMSRMQMGRIQLDNLVTVNNNFEVDDTFKADIVQHIEKSKVGDVLTKIIGEHVHEDVTYTRSFIVKKLTKVRTTIELLAKYDDGEIIEFRTTINKIGHNILDNTDKILKIHNALK